MSEQEEQDQETAREERELLKRSQVFSGLDDEQLARLHALAEPCGFEENEVIVEEDKQGVDCYFVLGGRVDIIIRSPFGSASQKIAQIKRGEMFGELSLVDGFLRSATAKASDPVSALRFSNAKLEELMDDDPRIGFTIMRNLANVLSSRIRNTNMKLRNALSDILY